jgi:hypothetical protein
MKAVALLRLALAAAAAGAVVALIRRERESPGFPVSGPTPGT